MYHLTIFQPSTELDNVETDVCVDVDNELLMKSGRFIFIFFVGYCYFALTILACHKLHSYLTSSSTSSSNEKEIVDQEKVSLRKRLRTANRKIRKFSRWNRAEKKFYNASLERECAAARLEMDDLVVELDKTKKELEEVKERADRLSTTHNAITHVIENFDPNFSNCVYRSNDWTLTELKRKAKDCGIPLLSKYNWSSRHSLAFVLWQVEHLQELYYASGFFPSIEYSSGGSSSDSGSDSRSESRSEDSEDEEIEEKREEVRDEVREEERDDEEESGSESEDSETE